MPDQKQQPRLLVYGAYGYTGALIARKLTDAGTAFVIAGRDPVRLAALASELSVPSRCFGLDTDSELDRGLQGIECVIHAAGPFSRTAPPMVSACLRNHCHYLDITGEIEVFEMCATHDRAAREKEVMLLPGAGFDVVPSDCLAAWLSQQLPDAQSLELAFIGLGGGLSHGTATTMVENIHRGGAIRRGGKIIQVPSAFKSRSVAFSEGRQTQVTSIPWGDVSTAWHSTGIPDITVYTALPGFLANKVLTKLMQPVLAAGVTRRLLQKLVDSKLHGPDSHARSNGKSLLWGQVQNQNGDTVEARLTTLDGYELTARTAVALASKVLEGSWSAGFQTPSLAYGADLILEFEGSERKTV